MNSKEAYLQVREERARVGEVWHPSQLEIQYMLASVYKGFDNGADQLAVDEEQTKQDLLDFKEKYLRDKGIEPSRALLCSTVTVSTLAKSSMSEAMNQKNMGRIPLYVLWFDVADGVYSAMEVISIGERELNGSYNRDITKSIGLLEGREALGLSVSSDKFLSMQRSARKISELLVQDPQGVSAITDRIRQLKTDNDTIETVAVPETQVKEFVVAGAETALRFYRAIYPLSADL